MQHALLTPSNAKIEYNSRKLKFPLLHSPCAQSPSTTAPPNLRTRRPLLIPRTRILPPSPPTRRLRLPPKGRRRIPRKLRRRRPSHRSRRVPHIRIPITWLRSRCRRRSEIFSWCWGIIGAIIVGGASGVGGGVGRCGGAVGGFVGGGAAACVGGGGGGDEGIVRVGGGCGGGVPGWGAGSA